MKTSRRNFLKGLGAATSLAFIPDITKSNITPVQSYPDGKDGYIEKML